MTLFVQQVINALIVGSMYLLVALGITLVYGLTRLVNFAQGELVTLGAFVCWELHRRGLPWGVSVVGATVIVALASEILDVGLFRRTINRPFNGFVISLGLIVALEGAYALIWPNDSYTISAPSIGGVWNLHGVSLEHVRVLLVGITLSVAAILIVGLNKTQLGRGVRAISQDRVATRVLGVPVGLLTGVTFMVGCGLAALAGALLGTIFSFNAYFGGQFLLDGFAVAIVGGLGNVGGAIIAAAVLSLCETLGGAYISLQWAPAFSLGAIILMILLRPHGLLRDTEAGESLGAEEAALTYGTLRSIGSHARDVQLLRTFVPRALLGIGAVVIVFAPWLLPTARLLSDATYAAVLATAAYGVWFIFRYVGILSIAHAAFMGLGAYAAALSVTHWNLNFWLQLLLAASVGAVSAAAMGAVALRTRGSYFLIVLFAFTELVVAVLTNWQSLTGGSLGMFVMKPAEPFGSLVDLRSLHAVYWLAIGFMVVIAAATVALTRSGFGRRLVTIRDDDVLANSLGLSTFRHRLGAVAISGAIAGIAGVLFLYQQTALEPSLFGVFPGVDLVLIVLLGGVGIVAGPVVGAIIFVFLPEVLGLGPNAVQLVYGLLLVAVMVVLPSGLGGSLNQLYHRLIDRRAVGTVRSGEYAVET